MTPIEHPAALKMGEWTASLEISDVPSEALRIAKRCLVDLFAVSIAGADFNPADMARKIAFTEHGVGKARVFGDHRTTTASGAAFANGVAAHVLDFDDTSYAGITHGTAVIGPAVIAAAQHAEVDGKTLLLGLISGSECAYSIGLATGTDPWFNGWWGTTIYGVIGAAAGAAKVFGLDSRETASAIALAAFGAGGMVAGLGTDAKPLSCGIASNAGVRAALLAKAGGVGPTSVFEVDRGYAKLFSNNHFDQTPLKQLGEKYALIEPGIFVKPYPCCTATHTSLEALSLLMSTNNLRAQDIDRVTVHAPRMVTKSLVYNNPQSMQESQFSIDFTAGCTMVDGGFQIHHLLPEARSSEAIRNARTKIQMFEDQSLTTKAETGEVAMECARVEVLTVSGHSFKLFNNIVTGAPKKPMSDTALDNKFTLCADHVGLDRQVLTDVLQRIRTCEEQASVADLWH